MEPRSWLHFFGWDLPQPHSGQIPLETVPRHHHLHITELIHNMDEIVESPCIGVCTLGDNAMCMGCFRTTEEISNWLDYSPEFQREIISKLPARIAQLFPVVSNS
jgi:predicted Fe-S protein YdhL (DUF1289 family)